MWRELVTEAVFEIEQFEYQYVIEPSTQENLPKDKAFVAKVQVCAQKSAAISVPVSHITFFNYTQADEAG